MSTQAMLEDRENRRFTALVRRIDEYLVTNRVKESFGTSVESLDRLPNGNRFIQKKMSCGLRIQAQIDRAKPIVTLQIFLDPLRFKSWTSALGPVEIFYMDPYGIEVFYKNQWKIAVDKEELSFKDTEDIYELARIKVEEIEGRRKLLRVA